MDAPSGIKQPNVWSAYLHTFAGADLSKQEADHKLSEIAKHIPAIYREITDSSQSLYNLRKAFENNKKLKSSCQYKPVVIHFYLLKEGCLPYDPKEFLEKSDYSRDPLAITDTDDFDQGCEGNSDKLASYLNAYLDQILYSNAPIDNSTFSTICQFLCESLESPFCANKSAILNVIYTWLERLYTYYSMPQKTVLSPLVIRVLSHPHFSGVTSFKLWKKVNLSDFRQFDFVMALLRDINYAAPLLVHHKKFQQTVANALQSIYTTYFSKLTVEMLFQPKAREFFCNYARLCLSISYLNPTLVPQQVHDFLFKRDGKPDILTTYQLLLLDGLDERHPEWIRSSVALIQELFSSTQSKAFPRLLEEILATLARVPSNEKKDYAIVSLLIAKAYALEDANLSTYFLSKIHAAFSDLHIKDPEPDEGFIDVVQMPKLIEDEFVLIDKAAPTIELTMANAAIDPSRFDCLVGLNIAKITFLKITPAIAALKEKFPHTLFVFEQAEQSLGDKFLSLFGIK